MTHERNIAHVRQSVGRSLDLSPHRTSLRKPNLAGFQSRRTFGSAWETNGGRGGGACVSRRASGFVPRRGASYFQLIMEDRMEDRESRVPAKNIFFPELVYRLSTPIICDAVGRVVERSRKKYACLHVSRINFSLALALLCGIRWVYRTDVTRTSSAWSSRTT